MSANSGCLLCGDEGLFEVTTFDVDAPATTYLTYCHNCPAGEAWKVAYQALQAEGIEIE